MPGVEQLVAGRVVEHRVDREVAATGGLLDRERRVALDRDAAVAGAGFRVAPRQRHVDGARDAGDAGELEDAKGLAHGVDLPGRGEHALERVHGQPEDLDVVVLQRQAEESVAHRPAHHVGPSPGGTQRVQQIAQAGGQVELHGLRQTSTSERTACLAFCAPPRLEASLRSKTP